MPPRSGGDWLARVQHDLVKRLLWPARDRRDLGGAVRPGELAPHLVDAEGRPISATALWQALAAEAPPELAAPARMAFTAAVADAEAAVRRDDLMGVLAVEEAWLTLARSVKGEG